MGFRPAILAGRHDASSRCSRFHRYVGRTDWGPSAEARFHRIKPFRGGSKLLDFWPTTCSGSIRERHSSPTDFRRVFIC
jgi:hypothetical protein